jgi:hypothetical protein
MRLSDLMSSRVVDADGTDLGTVDDVRMVQDGPLLLPFGTAFRVEGLMVGHRSLATRLGYVRGGVRGPWLLKVIFSALERRARYVDWQADVERWDGTTLYLTKRHHDLGQLPT